MKSYERLKKLYPPQISLDQLYKICRISKRSALYLIQNEIIPSKDNGKKTWRYTIELEDVIKYLRKRDRVGTMIPPGSVSSKYHRPNNPRRSFSEIVDSGDEKEISEYFSYIYADYPDVLKTMEVADMTGFSRETILRLLKSGEIKSIVQKPQYLIPKEYLMEYVSSRRYIESKSNTDHFRKILSGFNIWLANNKKAGGQYGNV